MFKKNVTKKEKKHFFKDFKAELKKVIWPTPKQLLNSVTAVLTIVVIVAIIVFILDMIFQNMNSYGINKLKSIVGDHKKQVEEVKPNNETNEAINNILNTENTNTESNDIENK